MWLKALWNHWKLKRKILTVFLPLTVLSTFLILIFSMSLLIKNGKAEALKNAKDKLTLVSDQTEQILANITYNIKAFSTSSSLQDAIRTEYPDNEFGNFLFSSAIHSSIYNIMDIQSLISSGYIQTYDGRVFNIKTEEIGSPDSTMDQRYKDIVSQKGRIILGPAMDKSGGSALSVSKSLIDINTGVCLGVLTFDIRESLFHASYESISDNSSGHFMLVDSFGTVISAENREELQTSAPAYILKLLSDSKTSEPDTLSGQNLIMISQTETGDYQVVYEMNYYRIYKEAFNLALLLLLIGMVVMFITIFLSTKLAHSIVRPITQLAAYADESGQGHFDLPIPVQSEDEIGFLAERFRIMNTNIKELTTCIYNEQNQKKEFELKMLQAQINPHFLYNCLDNISSLITDTKNDTAVSMVYHLGRYYRSILSKGRNIITIREEISMIRAYLEIQLIKAPDLFTYEIDMEPSIPDFKILKMILQPIAENSVIHGFAGYKNKGIIQIRGYMEDSDVCIAVTDNGKGIPKAILNTLSSPAQTAFPKHFGLKNIQERLQLKFGMNYGITIRSEENQKTVVMVRFPKTL